MKIRITQTHATRAKAPAEGNRIDYDSEIPGFGLRVTEKGAKSFVLNYVIHGRERRLTIGNLGEYTAETARAKAVEWRQQIREGIDPAAVKEQRANEAREAEARKRTVKQLSDAWIKQYAEPNKRPSSLREDRRLLAGVILPRLGSLHLGEVTRRDIAELHASLKATPYQANRAYALLHSMFAWAISDDSGEWAMTANPADGVHRFHEEKRDTWLREEEIQRLIDAMDAYPDKVGKKRRIARKQRLWLQQEAKRQMDALRLIMLTGCRKGEALTAKWADFDLERGAWTKPSHHTKQNRTEHIPLNEQARALLKGMPHEGEWLFPSGRDKARPDHLQDLKNVWKHVCKHAKLDSLHIHDLRHTFASQLVSRGLSLTIVGKLLGHAQPQTTARYAHLADDPLREAANQFPAALAVNGKAQ